MKFSVILIFMSFLIIGCGDDKPAGSSGPASNPSNNDITKSIPVQSFESLIEAENYFMDKKLQMVSVTIESEEAELENCNRDTQLRLRSDKNFSYKVNTPCFDDDFDEDGQWEVVKEENKLFLKLSSPTTVDLNLELIGTKDGNVTTKMIIDTDEGPSTVVIVYSVRPL